MPRYNYVAADDKLPGLRKLNSIEAANEDEAFDWILKNERGYTLVDLWILGTPYPDDIWTRPPMDFGLG